MNFKENESVDKLRGGYYTPTAISLFLAKWILEKKPEKILEPSCGDGSFIGALNGLHTHRISLTGVEIFQSEADKSRSLSLENEMLDCEIKNTDFLEWFLGNTQSWGTYDSVMGNPPYIRYQYLEKKDQEYSEKIFKKNGLAFTKHTNAWVPFIISGIDILKPGGRLAMVIPSELLHVLHASSLREYLLRTCSKIVIIDPNELLFEDALQGTVLLMTEKKKLESEECLGVSVISAPNNDFLESSPGAIFDSAECVSGDLLNGKWMKVFLDQDELLAFEKARSLPSVKRFTDIARVDVGIVTGANKFFLVDDETVDQYQLHDYVQPMFGRSEHCKGIIYSDETHKRNKANGYPTNFVYINNIDYANLTSGAKKYIIEGEIQELHTRYKCRIRKPWYTVPSVYKTEIGMLKRSHNYPRLILNSADAYTTDTAYRISSKVDAVSMVCSFINSLTALTAELEGRHYGGGVLELVPSEIEKVLIPLIDFSEDEIKALNKKIESSQDHTSLVREQDSKVLVSAGLTEHEADVLHRAWLRIKNRRHRLLSD